MNNQKKITRREAIKLIGAAASAGVLANLPSKWSKPSLTGGVLPVHAQTSCIALSIVMKNFDNSNGGGGGYGAISGPDADIFTDQGFLGPQAWYCQDACLELVFQIAPPAIYTVELSPIGHQKFTLNLNAGNSPIYVLVNLNTGEYSLDTNNTAGTCGWPVLSD